MERMLINASQRDEKRVAIVSENVLFDFITERPGFEQKIGNIYLARITSIEPSLDAIFVEFGSERHGFLPLKEISREYFNTKAEQQGRPGIRDLLRVGQELMIQVEKEERGNKGAALTTYISLAGSYLVLMPNSPRAGGISRRIEGDERDQLREILNQVTVPEGMGLIIRTAAIGRTNDELKWDLDVLLSHWNNIVAAAKSRSAPFLIHQEGNVVIRAIRDYVRQDTAEIIIDDEAEYQNAKHYLEQVRPDVADRVKLYSDTTPLFSRYGIEHQIETAYKRAIDLPSGASIVIDYTEALVSIDINSARATKGRNIESTAFNTNLEAAEEIARQLRLRDIGGLIVIDFIDMLEPSNQIEVEKHLTKALKNDRARIQIQRISRFGLLEMSRQRLRPSLRDSHQHVCPTCSGHGTIRSVDSVALTLVRIIEEEALKPHTAEIVVQASTEAATYLLNEKRHLLAALEKNHGVKVSVIPNPNLQSSNYLKKRIRVSDVDDSGVSSSDRLQLAQVDVNLSTASDRAVADKPAVRQMIPSRPEKASAAGGLVKRLWSSMFGQQDEEGEGGAEGRPSRPLAIEQKPVYSPRTPANRQRGRRPPRTEEGHESRDSRERTPDSRERSGTGRRQGDSTKSGERTGERTGDSRQRSTGTRQRTGGRSAPTNKTPSTDKPRHQGESYEDQYREYTQNTDRPVSGSVPRSASVTEQMIKSSPVDKLAEEAPITIKASTGSSYSPTSRSTSSGESSATTSSGTDQTSRPSSSMSTSSSMASQRPTSTTTYAPRSGSSSSSVPTQRSSSSYAPSVSPTPKPASASTPSHTATSSAAPLASITPIVDFSPGNSTAPTSSESSTRAPASTSSPTESSTRAVTSTVTPSEGSARPVTSSVTPSTSSVASSPAPAVPTSTTNSSETSQSFGTTATSARPSSAPLPASVSTSPLSEENQKPLIVRASSEDKPSTSTKGSLPTDKKDKESTE
jgi:ribonuclease E